LSRSESSKQHPKPLCRALNQASSTQNLFVAL